MILSSIMQFVSNPKKIIEWFVLLLCTCVSIYQLTGCIRKLKNPPVSTHYRFNLNETLYYPAVTICRNPGYKKEFLKEFNLGAMNSGMEQDSQWENFPFDKETLQNVWDKTTYSQHEVLWMYGLHGFAENAAVLKSYFYLQGQCFTLLPKVGEKNPGPKTGWSLMLGHDLIKKANHSNYKLLTRSALDSIAGFHIYIHQVREPYFENKYQTQSIMEYFYLEVGEELEIKITAEHYNQVSSTMRPCVADINYSASECSETRRWVDVANWAGCTGPWMPGIYLPQCNNAEQTRKLVKKYLSIKNNYNRGCNRSCNTTAYKLFVVNRIPSGRDNLSTLFLYYTSKLITVMEELPGYDWNSFLADIGGSLGFFLGISVIGAIGIIENLLKFFYGILKRFMKNNDKNELIDSQTISEKNNKISS